MDVLYLNPFVGSSKCIISCYDWVYEQKDRKSGIINRAFSKSKRHHLLLPDPAAEAPISLTNASLSFFRTTNLASSITFPSSTCPCPCPCTDPAFLAAFVALFLLCPNPAPDPQTTVQSLIEALAGTWHVAQTFECAPIFARRSMVARLSIVTEEWICAPGRTVASGAIVTLCEIRVGTPSLPPAGLGPPIVGEDTGEDSGAAPIVLFSLIMHPSPMITGPSKEYTRVRGCMTVSAPMAIG